MVQFLVQFRIPSSFCVFEQWTFWNVCQHLYENLYHYYRWITQRNTTGLSTVWESRGVKRDGRCCGEVLYPIFSGRFQWMPPSFIFILHLWGLMMAGWRVDHDHNSAATPILLSPLSPSPNRGRSVSVASILTISLSGCRIRSDHWIRSDLPKFS